MTNSAVPVRSTRIRILAVVGALALGLGLVPAQAAFADPTAGSITGTITEAGTGMPIAGAQVSLWSSTIGEGTATAEDGSFSYSSVPFDTYVVQVTAPGYVTYFQGGHEVSAAAPDLFIDIALIRTPVGNGTVSGVVTNQLTGAGIPNIEISLQADGPLVFPPSTRTGSDGAYSFTGVVSGGYRINVSTWGLPYQSYWGDTHVTVTSDAPHQTMNVALVPYASGTSLLTGSITDAQSGLPIDGATVTLSGQTVVYSGQTTTSSGAYSIDNLAAGQYWVSVSVGGYLAAGGEVVISDASTATWDTALIPQDALIQGRVTDPSGNGVPDFWVSVSGPTIGAGMTDADGYYTITNLAPGDYVMLVGGPGTPWSFQELSITAIADSAVTLDIQFVARTTSAIWGAVFDQNNNGIQYICADLVDAVTGAIVESTESWVDAMFEFQEVADGTYTVHLEDCAVSRPQVYESIYLGGGTTLAEAETFTIDGPADDLRLDDSFLAGPPTGWVALNVTDSVTGNPVTAPFTGYLEFNSTQYPISDWTESGSLQIRDLQYGEYDFYVVAPGYAGQRVGSVVIDATTPDRIIDLELTPMTDGHDHGQGHEQHGRGHGYGHDKH